MTRPYRNYRIETTVHENEGSLPSSTEVSVHEEQCQHCSEWFESRGVTGAIRLLCLGCPHCHRDLQEPVAQAWELTVQK